MCNKDLISISIIDGIYIRKVAYVNIGKNNIVAGTFSQTGEVDVHATYHEDGHCHVKRKKAGKINEVDLFDGCPILTFKGKINLFNRLFQRDISKLPKSVSILAESSDGIKLEFRRDNSPHLMSIFLIESGRMDLLPYINKEEYILYDKSSPWILVTFFIPSNDKWKSIMGNLKQSQHIVYDTYYEGITSREDHMKVQLWLPPEFNKQRDSVKLS